MKICSTEVGSLSEWMKSHGRQSFSTICKICKPEISASETFQSYLIDLEKAVRKSQKASAGRKERLAAAAQKPERFIVATVVFKRNPDVIAEVLDQAKGVCGRCKKPAPFKRVSDKSPYLEVHHLKHLAKGGRDIVANSIAVCPNCHRRYHFG
jgi:5-methylcytosine-specific restriction protein A